MIIQFRVSLLVAALALCACSPDSDSMETASSEGEVDMRSSAGYVVDSILPMEEELRRFRGADSTPIATVAGGAASPDELGKALFKHALTGDTAQLRQLHVTRQEFAWIYFPTSEFAAPPYELPPALVWYRLTGESDRGITKLMSLLTNSRAQVDSVRCPATPKLQGDNKIWEHCVTHFRTSTGETRSGELFGAILERNGVMKLLSFGNAL